MKEFKPVTYSQLTEQLPPQNRTQFIASWDIPEDEVVQLQSMEIYTMHPFTMARVVAKFQGPDEGLNYLRNMLHISIERKFKGL